MIGVFKDKKKANLDIFFVLQDMLSNILSPGVFIARKGQQVCVKCYNINEQPILNPWWRSKSNSTLDLFDSAPSELKIETLLVFCPKSCCILDKSPSASGANEETKL